MFKSTKSASRIKTTALVFSLATTAVLAAGHQALEFASWQSS
jgi:hypothetical protein